MESGAVRVAFDFSLEAEYSAAGTTYSKLPSSRYRGVVLQPNSRWGAQIYKRQKHVWLGTFVDEAEAARAYDVAAQRFRGRDAVTNFVPLSAEDEEGALALAFLAKHSKAEIVDMLRKHTFVDELRHSKRASVGAFGVSRRRAQIYKRQKRVWLSTFVDEAEAARTYDVAAQRFRGRDAVTNFVPLSAEDEEGALALAFLAKHSKAEIVDMLRKHTFVNELRHSKCASAGAFGVSRRRAQSYHETGDALDPTDVAPGAEDHVQRPCRTTDAHPREVLAATHVGSGDDGSFNRRRRALQKLLFRNGLQIGRSDATYSEGRAGVDDTDAGGVSAEASECQFFVIGVTLAIRERQEEIKKFSFN
ncbi:hypothetical protein ZIOFF_010185 [Zingiber officinale]|uniref:AP2/ERF domain-containing protein n=1 Tax=Zingiber officinale TaxID=94328 RepID=A0A8J5LY46_ZINOF|nr:hypothetical protein ZIOFF_010185 [Zingiber officinale]